MKILLGLLAMLGLAAGPALAADPPAPEAVVTEMYQSYFDALNAVNASGSMENMPNVFDQVLKYATPELAARIEKAKVHPDPVIDWDFLADGQDFQDLKLVSAKTTATTGTTATVRVQASNMGSASETDVMLAKTAEGWRVADFTFWPGKPESTTLDAVLKGSGL